MKLTTQMKNNLSDVFWLFEHNSQEKEEMWRRGLDKMGIFQVTIHTGKTKVLEGYA